MSWFSDWGTSSWAEDLEAAANQAYSWASTTADARGWSQEWTDYAYQLIEEAEDAGEGWVWDSTEDFWVALTTSWSAVPNPPAGWDELGTAFASAAGTTYTVTASRDEGSAASVVGGALSETTTDLAATADPEKSPYPWIAAGLVLVGLVLIVRS